MDLVNVSKETREIVLSSLKRIDYKNCVDGIRPTSIEGKIVSDADMCDAIGANGILRTHKYGMKFGRVFFNKESNPDADMNINEYKEKVSGCCVHHMFEKLFKLKGLMITDSGKKEASNRHELMVKFLYQLFDEEEADNWKEYLDNYLANL